MSKSILASFTVMGPLIWYVNANVHMSKILDINYNHFHHLGRSQMCAGAWYVFRTSESHSEKLWGPFGCWALCLCPHPTTVRCSLSESLVCEIGLFYYNTSRIPYSDKSSLWVSDRIVSECGEAEECRVWRGCRLQSLWHLTAELCRHTNTALQFRLCCTTIYTIFGECTY